MNIETNQVHQREYQYAHMDVKEIVLQDIRTERQENIPAARLILEESIIDEVHRDDLLTSMRGDRGQISPITVRARLGDDGEIVYDIIDGFHRSAAMRLMAFEEKREVLAKAVVVYGCSDEELYDLRILAVNSVRSVSYSRLFTWMQMSFKQTEWHKRGFSLSQIISMARRDSERSNFGFTPEDIEKAKSWATEKARKWNKTVPSLYMDILAVEQADPELLKRVRIGGGGTHEKRGVINPASFRAIVQAFPGDFHMQHTLADVVSEHNLHQDETRKVAEEMKTYTENKQALILLKNDPRSIIGEFKDVDVSEYESIKKRVITKNQLYSQHEDSSEKKLSIAKELQNLRKENFELKIALEDAKKALDISGGSGNALWYETIQDLSDLERSVMRMFFKEGRDREEIAHSLHVLLHTVDGALQSGQKKYLLSRDSDKLDVLINTFTPKKRV